MGVSIINAHAHIHARIHAAPLLKNAEMRVKVCACWLLKSTHACWWPPAIVAVRCEKAYNPYWSLMGEQCILHIDLEGSD